MRERITFGLVADDRELEIQKGLESVITEGMYKLIFIEDLLL